MRGFQLFQDADVRHTNAACQRAWVRNGRRGGCGLPVRMTSFFINGKFARQHTTGVQRVASELVKALDRSALTRSSRLHCELLLPKGASAPPLRHIATRVVDGSSQLPVWEQVYLPRAARSRVLLNFGGSAPAKARAQACFMHDAAVFDHPEAYSWKFRSWYRFLFRRLSRSDATIFTVSTFSQERLASQLRVSASRIRVVPCGADHLSAVDADPSLVGALRLEQHSFLLVVGSASPTKNIDALVQAWCKLNRSDARLVIIGGVNPIVFAREGVVQAPGVIQLGYVSDGQLKALYRHAAGLVFPSLYEGFGLPPLEAMACGCAVAISNAASLPEVCGDAALYFDPRNVDAMVDAMQALLDETPLRESLRERGHRRAAAFRWDDSAAALLRGLGAEA